MYHLIDSISKYAVAIAFFSFLILSCNYSDWGSSKNKSTALTLQQESALAAFTKLQLSSDEKDRLYSTFPGIEHACFPPDTSYIISQAQLLFALRQFSKENYKRMKSKDCERLLKSAVQAQREYTVLHCKDRSSQTNNSKEHSMTGSWVIPNILDRVDVTMVW